MNKKKEAYVLDIEPKRIRFFIDTLENWASGNLRDFPWRKKTVTNYKIILTELFLQRTRAETIAKFYHVFFREYPSWKVLNETSIEELERSLMPVGLYKRRAKILKQLAQVMVSRNGRFPRNRTEINMLPGIGQYIANAIELFISGKPLPLLDVNMSRLLERFFGPRHLADIRYDPYLQELSKVVISHSNDPKRLNWIVLDYASVICTSSSPKCDKCGLISSCCYMAHNRL